MAQDGELEARVTALESDMRAVRQDAAAARVLAGGADRDVAALTIRFDAQQRLLMALRETQIEHGVRLFGVEGRLEGVEGRLEGVEGRLETLEDEMRRGFAVLALGQNRIVDILTRLDPDSPADPDDR